MRGILLAYPARIAALQYLSGPSRPVHRYLRLHGNLRLLRPDMFHRRLHSTCDPVV